MAGIIRHDIEQLGIKVNFQVLEFNTLVSKLNGSFAWDAILLGLTGGGDPHFGKNVWMSSGQLHMWYPLQSSPATKWEKRIDEIFKEIDCFKLSIPLEDVIMDAEKIINQKMLTVKEGKIENVVKLISFLNKYDLLPSLWKAQNIFFDLLKEKKLFYEKKEERNLFIELGELLGFKMDYFIKYPFPS